MARRAFRPSTLLALAGAAIGLAAPAQASILTWNSAAGGSASVATNWNPNQIPTSADDLIFNLNTAYSVTLTSSAASSRTWTVNRGIVTLELQPAHAVSAGITIADVVGDIATLQITSTLSNTTFTSSGLVVIADAAGSTGTLRLPDKDVEFTTLTSAGDMIVGNNGAAALDVITGGHLTVADRFIAGSNTSSTATITVSGKDPIFTVYSELTVLGTGLASAIGAGGDATMTISNGGTATFAGTLNIAQGQNSVSSVTISATGSNSSLTVGGNLNIGANTTPGSSGGNGSLSVSQNCSVDVTGILAVGNDPDGGIGALTVTRGGVRAQSVIVNDTNGTLTLSGGTITCVGGTFDPPTSSFVIDGPTLTNVALNVGAQATFSDPATALTLGAVGSGGLIVRDPGSLATITQGNVVVADQPGSVGFITLANQGTLTLPPSSLLQVGRLGNGRLQIDGGHLNAADIHVGPGPATTCLAFARNAGTITASGRIFVGGDSSTAQSASTFEISSAGVVNANSPVSPAFLVWNNAAATIQNATLNAPSGLVDILGDLTLTSGSINAPAFRIRPTSTATYDLSGLINADVAIEGASPVINLSGNLTLGSTAPSSGVANTSGQINVGNHALTLHAASTIQLGDLSIGDTGELIGSAPSTINAGKTLSGSGTISIPINNAGAIISTGDGLTFTKPVSSTGGSFSGEPTFWINGASFSGSGFLSTKIRADASTVFTATGNLFVGPNAVPDAIEFAGTVRTLAHDFTFFDSDGITLGVLTELAGGIFRVTNDAGTEQPTLLPSGSRIAGSGTFASSLLTSEGAIDVGDTPSTDIGGLITRELSLRPTSTVNMQLAGPSITQSDQLVALGPVSLNGTFNVAFHAGFTPTQHFQVGLIRATALSGAFATVNLPPKASLSYTATDVLLNFCPSDVNSSGTLSIQDIFDFLNAWFSANPNADFNSSGTLSIQDIFDFLNSWFAGC